MVSDTFVKGNINREEAYLPVKEVEVQRKKRKEK